MAFAVFWLGFAVVVGVYASRRGRSGLGWFLLAAVVSPLLAFLLCLALGPLPQPGSTGQISPDTHVKCPDCRELVLADARICKHCGAKLVPQVLAVQPEITRPDEMNFALVWQRNKAVIIVLAALATIAITSGLR